MATSPSGSRACSATSATFARRTCRRAGLTRRVTSARSSPTFTAHCSKAGSTSTRPRRAELRESSASSTRRRPWPSSPSRRAAARAPDTRDHDDRRGHAARAGAARHRESRRRGDGGGFHRRTAMATERVSEILSWYGSDNPGTLTNLARLLNHGALAGTGRLVILPVDQGFEHGPGQSFAMNPTAYDPRYHFELAIEAGCSAYAAPLGFLEAGAREFAGRVPLILKLSNHDVLLEERDPNQAITGSVRDALRLGCVAIGFTIYPGSEHRLAMYGQLRGLAEEAKANGLAVIVWSYPRGSGLSKEGETAIDVTAYAAHIAAQLC